MIQAHFVYSALYFRCYYISSASDHQKLDARAWEPLTRMICPHALGHFLTTTLVIQPSSPSSSCAGPRAFALGSLCQLVTWLACLLQVFFYSSITFPVRAAHPLYLKSIVHTHTRTLFVSFILATISRSYILLICLLVYQYLPRKNLSSI